MRKCVAVLLTSSCLAVNLSAQTSRPPDQTNLARDGAVALSALSGADRESVFYRIRGMVEDISSFQSPAVKADGLSRMADIIWRQDEPYTRALFNKALGLTDVTGDDKGSKALSHLRRDIIARIARHDAGWAELLIDEVLARADERQGAAERRELNVETAKRLQADDPKLAADFASRSLQGGVSPEFVWLLKSLRQRDEAAANRLFMGALGQFAQLPAADPNAFAMFGTYIFTSPKLDAGGDPSSVMITRVGDVGVVDITADLPNVPPSLVQAYLRTAVGLLRRPTPDARQRKTAYALAHLLMPKARKFAPDLAAPLGALLAELSAGVPAAMTQEAAFTYINKNTVETPEQVMSSAERLPDAESRDIAYLDVAFHAWLRKDFATAQVASGKIENKDARARLETLIEFGRGAAKLKDGGRHLPEAAEIAERLSPGVERAVLYLGVSERAFRNKNSVLAGEAAARARTAALSLTDPRRPHLLLLAASQLARHDLVAAEAAFNEGIKGFNASDGRAPAGPALEQKVQVGELVESFPLAVPGLDLSFNKAFRSVLTVASVDGGISRARELKSEQLRMSAFVALADELLKTLPREEAADEAVVRVGEDGMRKSAEKTVMPVYPEDALKNAQQGVAVVEAQYNGKGEVTDAVVLEAPSPAIGQAVVEAARQWKFKPSTLAGKPISIRGKLTFYFVIGEDGKGRVENPKQFQ